MTTDRTEMKIVLAILATFFLCVCVCMATIFLVASISLRERRPVEPLYQVVPGIGYPGPAPAPIIPEKIGPPSSEPSKD